jgi:hypothetical protein
LGIQAAEDEKREGIVDAVGWCERLGGLSSYYYRNAA